MTQEMLKHEDMILRFCPIINYSCKGAACMSFKADEVSRVSTKHINSGDWEPILVNERRGYCANPNVMGLK